MFLFAYFMDMDSNGILSWRFSPEDSIRLKTNKKYIWRDAYIYVFMSTLLIK